MRYKLVAEINRIRKKNSQKRKIFCLSGNEKIIYYRAYTHSGFTTEKEEIQFFYLFFPFLTISKLCFVRFRLFDAWNVHTVVFLPIFYSVNASVVCIVSGGCDLSTSLCNFQIVVSMHQCYVQYRWFLFDIILLFSGSFVEVVFWSALRIVSSIIQRFLSLWWDYCYIVCFRVVFLFSWSYSLRIFHISISWEYFAWVGVTPTFLKSFEFFSELWPILQFFFCSDGPGTSSDFPLFQPSNQAFDDCFKRISYNMYQRYLHVS